MIFIIILLILIAPLFFTANFKFSVWENNGNITIKFFLIPVYIAKIDIEGLGIDLIKKNKTTRINIDKNDKFVQIINRIKSNIFKILKLLNVDLNFVVGSENYFNLAQLYGLINQLSVVLLTFLFSKNANLKFNKEILLKENGVFKINLKFKFVITLVSLIWLFIQVIIGGIIYENKRKYEFKKQKYR